MSDIVLGRPAVKSWSPQAAIRSLVVTAMLLVAIGWSAAIVDSLIASRSCKLQPGDLSVSDFSVADFEVARCK